MKKLIALVVFTSLLTSAFASEFGKMSVDFPTIKVGSDTGTERTIEFWVQTCLVDAPDGRSYKILKPNGYHVRSHPSAKGCIAWTDEVTYDFTAEEEILYTRTYTIIERHSGETVDRSVLLNPWQYKNDFGFDTSDRAEAERLLNYYW